MSTSKIKTIVLAVLLLVNIFFLALIIMERIDTGKSDSRMREDLVKVMAANGINLNKAAIPKDVSLTQYRVGRDQKQELEIAQAILGECSYEDRGGNIYSYASSAGEAQFRGNGEFEIIISEQADIGYLPGDVDKLIKNMGLEATRLGTERDEKTTKIRFQCTIDEKNIFGCTVEFVFERGKLCSVAGKKPTSDPQYRTDSEFISVATALMGFADSMSSGGYVCSSINNIESGYMFFVAVSGERTLTPVWSLTTDSGDYYVDGISGEVLAGS